MVGLPFLGKLTNRSTELYWKTKLYSCCVGINCSTAHVPERGRSGSFPPVLVGLIHKRIQLANLEDDIPKKTVKWVVFSNGKKWDRTFPLQES